MPASHLSPVISIIIPCYNYGHYLKETVESVLSQDFDSWECLIIDDGSTDSTFEVVKEFIQKDKRIQYHFKKNGGLSDARNYGFRKLTPLVKSLNQIEIGSRKNPKGNGNLIYVRTRT